MPKARRWKLSQMNLPYLIQELTALDPKKRWEIIIQEQKSQRTLEQNRRYWDLLRSIGDHLGYTADEMHLLMGHKFLREQKQVGNETIEVIKSTTDLDTAQMTRYQEQIELWAGQMGWSWDSDHV